MRNLIIFCFVLICSVSFAQQHPTPNTNCQLTVEQILREQSFDIDEPISEEAMYIFQDMYEELNFIYQLNANAPERVEHIENFQLKLDQANSLNLNLSMFQADIDFVSNLNQ
ncbi:hypothetical protein [Brumimicrobium mesophilum]|uniref:hypothetical protein n=1 Tax=Brumimicrobium mesophilum TaxID=392717 RepID=UPI000D141E65|nr:hypothetical protein [Brumimicrobium mesophilum]